MINIKNKLCIMKNKILKAINEGILKVLSTDIED